MSTNAIPLDRLKWVQMSTAERAVFRTWSTSESRENVQPQPSATRGSGFGRRAPGTLDPAFDPALAPPSLRRKTPPGQRT
jgi:hypothetical protein